MAKPKKSNPAAPLPQPSAAYAPPVNDPIAGKKALLALTRDLDSLAPDDFTTLSVDVEIATYAALGVAGFLGDPQVRARFARLPTEEFDRTLAFGLEPACVATLYALGEARAAGALATDIKVPADTAAEAAEVEGRMQAVCEYHLSDDPKIKPELERLRPGSGNRDIANDLLGYARIYELRPEVVKTDPKNYRIGDLAKARELAGKIIQALSASMTPRAQVAYDRYVRAWTWLNRCYDEVRPAGLWLYRKEAQKDPRFPSLFAVGRAKSGRAKKPTEGPAPGRGLVVDGEGDPAKK